MMLCEECGIHPATVSITVSAGGEMSTRHLCQECMAKMQLNLTQGNIQSFLSSVLSILSSKKEQEQIRCERCGLSYSDFERTGRLGCANCYQAFADQLKPLLQRIHGCTQHIGRAPRNFEHPRIPDETVSETASDVQPLQQEALQEEMSPLQIRLDSLRHKMDDAVASENFEDAAKYRDEIKALTTCEEVKRS